mmetsp:Transcript_29137/g.46789  ORF Transcript_29137/g.46789 Transcript_29137/m.46789 type:complete len:737 (-) Transcript_29137:90-2300(-)
MSDLLATEGALQNLGDVNNNEEEEEEFRNRTLKQVDAVNEDLKNDLLFHYETVEAKMAAISNAPYYLQGYDGFDTPRTLKKRQNLETHPKIIKAIKRFWDVFKEGQTEKEYISQDEYTEVHVRMNKALRREVSFDLDEAKAMALKDFAMDSSESKISGRLEFKPYCRSVFVLADLWTDSVDPEDYANFLQILFFRITRPRSELEGDDDDYNPPTFDLDNIELSDEDDEGESRQYKDLKDIVPLDDEDIMHEYNGIGGNRRVKKLMIGDRDQLDMSARDPSTISALNSTRTYSSRANGTMRVAVSLRSKSSSTGRGTPTKAHAPNLTPSNRRQKREPKIIDKRYENRTVVETQSVYEYCTKALDHLVHMPPARAQTCLVKVIKYLFKADKIDPKQQETLTKLAHHNKGGDGTQSAPSSSIMMFMRRVIEQISEGKDINKIEVDDSQQEDPEFKEAMLEISDVIEKFELADDSNDTAATTEKRAAAPKNSASSGTTLVSRKLHSTIDTSADSLSNLLRARSSSRPRKRSPPKMRARSPQSRATSGSPHRNSSESNSRRTSRASSPGGGLKRVSALKKEHTGIKAAGLAMSFVIGRLNNNPHAKSPHSSPKAAQTRKNNMDLFKGTAKSVTAFARAARRRASLRRSSGLSLQQAQPIRHSNRSTPRRKTSNSRSPRALLTQQQHRGGGGGAFTLPKAVNPAAGRGALGGSSSSTEPAGHRHPDAAKEVDVRLPPIVKNR